MNAITIPDVRKDLINHIKAQDHRLYEFLMQMLNLVEQLKQQGNLGNL